ncbi:IclR family transcriptional regulator [Peribacillus simplex]|uniref:IclR family transcriptional regulator n=1 Tax=Peribacillus simplex TaxID=1478 RepID=UPI0036713CF1
MGEIKNSTTISSVEKAIDILLALQSKNNKSIRELGEELNISKSALHRTLQTLESRGFVKQDQLSEKYSLGYKILELSASLKKDIEIRNLAYEHMEELRNLVGDTIQLAILNGESILIIETVDGTNDLRVFSQAGEKYPITYGNFGRVFLSQFSTEEVKRYIKKYPLKRYASKSIVDEAIFLEKLKTVKDLGLSTSIDDPIEGAFSMAAPIYDFQGNIVASLAISGVKRFQSEKSPIELEKLTKLYAAKISKEFK